MFGGGSIKGEYILGMKEAVGWKMWKQWKGGLKFFLEEWVFWGVRYII